jgi:hypothetical protein
MRHRRTSFPALVAIAAIALCHASLLPARKAEAQHGAPGRPPEILPFRDRGNLGLPPIDQMTLPGEEAIGPQTGEAGEAEAPEAGEEDLIPPEEAAGIEGGEAGEGETRWKVRIDGAVRANYVFNDSPDAFVVKYRWEIDGQANATTAVMRGDAEISADVEGFLSKWPTGECSLSVTIPKVPFEITFQKTTEDKGTIALKFRQAIAENWSSNCTFIDAPGARFNTSGDTEKLLSRALEKARPPLRSIIADITDDETTTSFVIPKEIIDDPPLGTIEIEGTGVITITPGG